MRCQCLMPRCLPRRVMRRQLLLMWCPCPGAPLPETEAAHELVRGAPSGDAELAHADVRHGLPSTRRFTSAQRATQYLTGREPCGLLLMPPAAGNHVTTSVDGSAVLPTPVTSAPLTCFFRALHLPLERCCHRLGRIPRVPSRLLPHMRMSHSPVRTSVFSSFASCACRSHLHRGPALAAGRLMCAQRSPSGVRHRRRPCLACHLF